MEVDFLLVGQGIAGTSLSYRLINSGKRVYVIDQAGKNTCSRVAAGLFNPVTGRKLVKTWNADLIFPEIVPFYSRLEEELQVKFLFSRNVYFPFASLNEQNEWMGRSVEEEYKSYIKEVKTTSSFHEVHDPYGGLFLDQSGYVDMNLMLSHYAIWLEEQGLLSNAAFEEDELEVTAKGLQYKDIRAQSIIYANGMGAVESRYFHWLPLKPNKGEILEVKQKFTPEDIINRGVFRITLPNNTIRVGSTYNVLDLEPNPTDEGKKEILYRLGKLVDLPVEEILEHKWGIRPTTMDRRPILGKHPDKANVYIFNGLGAKGASLAPYFSKLMMNCLIYEKEPPKEVNLSRFFKYI